MTSGTLAVPASHLPALVPGTCQVWWARPGDVAPEHDVLLASDELERRCRLLRAADRERFTAGVVVARTVLGAHAGRPADELRIDRTCPHCGRQHGKPRLPEVPDLHFSVSHSADCVVVAVGRGAPVGVDVEHVGAWHTADLDEVALLTLAREERAVLARQPAGLRAAAFTTYWTRKEAAVKATGAGLTAPLDEIVVSSPSSPPRVLRWADPAGGEPPVLRTLRPPAGYEAALAVAGDMPTSVVETDAGPLLRALSSAAG
jgi:4'-phosphopantetheinyl transferase